MYVLSINEMALLSPYSSKYGPILLKFYQSYSKVDNQCLYSNSLWTVLQKCECLWKQNIHPLHFCPHFPLKMAKIKTKTFSRKNLCHWSIQKSLKLYLLSPFQEKYHLVYGLFFGKKQDAVTSQRVRFKIWHTLLQSHYFRAI